MRLIILAIVIYLLYRVFKSVFRATRELKRRDTGGVVVDEMVQDPSCKTYIPLTDARSRVIGGTRYYFCSRECMERFELEMKGGRST